MVRRTADAADYPLPDVSAQVEDQVSNAVRLLVPSPPDGRLVERLNGEADSGQEVAREAKQLAEEGGVLRVVEGRDVVGWDHQHVRRRLRVRVLERQHAVATLDDRRRDVARGDFAKDAPSRHGPLPWRPALMDGARGQLASECLAQLLPEFLARVSFRRRCALDLGELLEHGALLRCQLERGPHVDANVQVAAPRLT